MEAAPWLDQCGLGSMSPNRCNDPDASRPFINYYVFDFMSGLERTRLWFSHSGSAYFLVVADGGIDVLLCFNSGG